MGFFFSCLWFAYRKCFLTGIFFGLHNREKVKQAYIFKPDVRGTFPLHLNIMVITLLSKENITNCENDCSVVLQQWHRTQIKENICKYI